VRRGLQTQKLQGLEVYPCDSDCPTRRPDLVTSANGNESGVLLHALGARFGVNQSLKNSQNMTPVIDHAAEEVAESWVALRLTMPLQEHCGRDCDVSPKLFGGVPPQEQTVEEGSLPLWEVEIVLSFFGRIRLSGQRRVGFSLHPLL